MCLLLRTLKKIHLIYEKNEFGNDNFGLTMAIKEIIVLACHKVHNLSNSRDTVCVVALML